MGALSSHKGFGPCASARRPLLSAGSKKAAHKRVSEDIDWLMMKVRAISRSSEWRVQNGSLLPMGALKPPV